jgi:hypothetical protein
VRDEKITFGRKSSLSADEVIEHGEDQEDGQIKMPGQLFMRFSSREALLHYQLKTATS